MSAQPLEKIDIWAALAAKLPTGVISWRQDGRVINRDGRYLARFVAYIEANTVRERLDSVVPGEWDLTLDPLPPVVTTDDDANMGACNFKARLQILGVIREDVGTGKDWKQAATDSLKRAAVRFGIGHELYEYEQNWVQMDGMGSSRDRWRIPASPTRGATVARVRRVMEERNLPALRRGARLVVRLNPRRLPPRKQHRPNPVQPRMALRMRATRCARNVKGACGTTASRSAIRRRPTSSAAIAPATA
jgi:hypothetical protein